jgi:chromosome segregation ATPase
MSRPLKGQAKSAGVARAVVPSRTLAEAERECADLRAELAAARARIDELEALRRRALDRVEWAIDSVHTLLEQKPVADS